MFSISQIAKARICSLLRDSDETHPVASLDDSTGDLRPSSEMLQGLSSDVAEAELRSIAKREYSQVASVLDYRLNIGVYASVDCRADDLVQVNEIPFVMPKEMLNYLRGFTLDYEDGQFFLTNDQRTFVRLGDLLAENGNAV